MFGSRGRSFACVLVPAETRPAPNKSLLSPLHATTGLCPYLTIGRSGGHARVSGTIAVLHIFSSILKRSPAGCLPLATVEPESYTFEGV